MSKNNDSQKDNQPHDSETETDANDARANLALLRKVSVYEKNYPLVVHKYRQAAQALQDRDLRVSQLRNIQVTQADTINLLNKELDRAKGLAI